MEPTLNVSPTTGGVRAVHLDLPLTYGPAVHLRSSPNRPGMPLNRRVVVTACALCASELYGVVGHPRAHFICELEADPSIGLRGHDL